MQGVCLDPFDVHPSPLHTPVGCTDIQVWSTSWLVHVDDNIIGQYPKQHMAVPTPPQPQLTTSPGLCPPGDIQGKHNMRNHRCAPTQVIYMRFYWSYSLGFGTCGCVCMGSGRSTCADKCTSPPLENGPLVLMLLSKPRNPLSLTQKKEE